MGNNKGGARKYDDSAMGKRYNSYRDWANRKCKVFELTYEQFKEISSMNCYYCNKEPGVITHDPGPKHNYIYESRANGIDRLNSELGYTSENCVPSCTACNYMKRSLNLKDFFKHITSIYNHHRLNERTLDND